MMIPDILPSVLVSPRMMMAKMSKNIRGSRMTLAITQSEGATPGAWSRYTFIKVRCFSFAMDHTSSQIQRRKKNYHGKEILWCKYISKSGFTINNGHLRCYFLRSYLSVNMFMLAVGENARFVYVFLYYILSNKQRTINDSHGKVIKSREFISKSPWRYTWHAIWDVTFSTIIYWWIHWYWHPFIKGRCFSFSMDHT